MNRLQQQWATVTTATKPSHEYVTATTIPHASLSAVEREHLLPGAQVDVARRVDLGEAMSDLRSTATDLVELTHAGAQEGSSAARRVRSTLEISVQPAATIQMSATSWTGWVIYCCQSVPSAPVGKTLGTYLG